MTTAAGGGTKLMKRCFGTHDVHKYTNLNMFVYMCFCAFVFWIRFIVCSKPQATSSWPHKNGHNHVNWTQQQQQTQNGRQQSGSDITDRLSRSRKIYVAQTYPRE